MTVIDFHGFLCSNVSGFKDTWNIQIQMFNKYFGKYVHKLTRVS